MSKMFISDWERLLLLPVFILIVPFMLVGLVISIIGQEVGKVFE